MAKKFSPAARSVPGQNTGKNSGQHPGQNHPGQNEVQPLLNLLNQGKLNQAELLAKALLVNYPNTFILHNVLGIVLNGQNKLEEAIASYSKAAALQPNAADIYFNIGIALATLQRLDEAASYYRKAIRLQPVFFEAYGNLGTVLQRQGKLEEAIASYRKALSINPDAIGHFNLATALRDQGQLDEAASCYRAAIALHPHYADAHNNLGETLRDQGNMTEAVNSYQFALSLDASHAQANYNLAEFLLLIERYDEAIAHFETSQLEEGQQRILYCLYRAKKFEAFKLALDRYSVNRKHTSAYVANLAAHYAINFQQAESYNFCKNAMQFVYQHSIPELAADSPLLKDLLRDIESAEIAQRKQGRLHNGIQSAGNLFKREEASFKTLANLIRQQFEAYRKRFAASDCELIHSFPQQLEFTSSWYVKMHQGGHLTSHFHELGWLSGAVYLKMPQKQHGVDEGDFEYGAHGDNYPQMHSAFPSATIAPNVGDIVLFPSSLFHRTIPFQSDQQRICIAFDLRPSALSAAI